MADQRPDFRSDMPSSHSQVPPITSGQRSGPSSLSQQVTQDHDSASGPRASSIDETQGAPLELQTPISAAPSKYDLARRRIGLLLDDKWRLERLLGVGGMAAVYAATHRNGATAAIKLLPFTLSTGPEVCQRLLREGYLANRIQHPAVTRVLDDQIDYDKEHAYIVMELLEGETARQRVERLGPLEPKQVVDMMRELADCLRAAHAANVVHRDIKPENLFITSKGLKVLDFGIARALDGSSNLTQTGTSLGTPAYMSPEQARGKHRQLGPRSDIYSLGATMLFLLTGENLHEGENALELMVRAAWTPAPPSRELCPSLPEALATIIDRCCAFEPDERYPDADALMTALDSLDHLPERLTAAPRASRPRPTRDSGQFDSLLETASASVPPRPTRANRRWWAAVLVVAVAGLALWIFGRGAERPELETSLPLPPSTSAVSDAEHEPSEVHEDRDEVQEASLAAPPVAEMASEPAGTTGSSAPPTERPRSATHRQPPAPTTKPHPPRTKATWAASTPRLVSPPPSADSPPSIDYSKFRD